ncbi:hypothetical protein LJC11_00135 [Bacteroidales bacterium OttesenSCG-928-I21]|nr:hypothetical protein [Bacteroidales bacterium OttesenSCG-928-I21]
MDLKKRLTLITLGIILILPMITTGCFKKGEEDPFMSMYTRKARMVGKWKYANSETNIRTDVTNSSIGDYAHITTTTTDDAKWTQRIDYEATDSSVIYNGTLIQNETYLQFTKHGTFTKNYVYEYVVVDYDEDAERETRHRYRKSLQASGTWNFLSGVDEFKDKERVTLAYEVVTSRDLYGIRVSNTDDDEGSQPTESIQYIRDSSWYYANGELNEIWELQSLKNKEIKMYRPVYNKFSSTSGYTVTEQGYYKQTMTQ